MTRAAGRKRTSGIDQKPLTEDEIRPAELMAGQAERYRADVARLLEGRESFVGVPCPACGNRSATSWFSKYTLSYLHCGHCRTIYISPRPTPDQLKTYYTTSENYAYWNEHVFPASEPARREKVFIPRVERILSVCDQHQTRRDTLLEVGAGFGIFCQEMSRRKAFRRVVAVEPTPDLASTCRRRGIEVIETPIEEVAEPSLACDVIASFEVIEHLFEPLSFLQACRRWIRGDGLLVITCPNGLGFDIQMLGPESTVVDTEHLNYFNPHSMTLLLARAGFEAVEITTPGKLDAELVRKAAQDGRLHASLDPFMKRLLLDDWDRLGQPFQLFLATNGLSSHMWVVARPAMGKS